MSDSDNYLYQILIKYAARNPTSSALEIIKLRSALQSWSGQCFISILDSGSRAKGTAISLASDVDYLVSLVSNCNDGNGGLKGIYESLFSTLNASYQNVRKQNVSIRINLNGLQVDITPARKQPGITSDHNLYVSKGDTWRQTNIQKHINDVSGSGRSNEIKIVKIWRELNRLDFPSIYLEYLLISNVLSGRPRDPNSLANNFYHILFELAKDSGNPLFARIVDPANSNNVLSDLLNTTEKNAIKDKAKASYQESSWARVVW